MKKIKLTCGFSTIVDDEDFEELSKHKWQYNSIGYAVRTVALDDKTRTSLYMHVAIMGKIDGLEIDHINGNKLYNRRENLRHVTREQNNQNRKPNKNASSKYKGVCWHKNNQKWGSQIKINGKCIYLGSYKSEEDAALAYNEAAIRLQGQYARLNTIDCEGLTPKQIELLEETEVGDY